MRSLLLMSFSELGKAGSDTFASTNVQQDLKFGWMLSNVSTIIYNSYDPFLETSLNLSLTQINFLKKILFLFIIYIEQAIFGLSRTIFIASSNQSLFKRCESENFCKSSFKMWRFFENPAAFDQPNLTTTRLHTVPILVNFYLISSCSHLLILPVSCMYQLLMAVSY